MHWGLLGMKWGVRRWQNEDGPFNEEGKERYFGKKSNKEIDFNSLEKQYTKMTDDDKRKVFNKLIPKNIKKVSSELNNEYLKIKKFNMNHLDEGFTMAAKKYIKDNGNVFSDNPKENLKIVKKWLSEEYDNILEHEYDFTRFLQNKYPNVYKKYYKKIYKYNKSVNIFLKNKNNKNFYKDLLFDNIIDIMYSPYSSEIII